MKPEQNFIDICLKSSILLGGEYRVSNNYSFTITPGLEWYSRIFNIKLIANILNDMNHKTIPKTVILSENDLSTIKQLEHSGFKKNITQTYMEYDLWNFTNIPRSSDIVIINTVKLLGKWFSTLKQIFNVSQIDLFQELLKEKDIIILGVITNNQIVGTALLFEQEKISGLHFIGILP